MTRLTEKQIQNKLNFISNYVSAFNASDGSTFDPNANVSSKNIATLNAELNKDINIQIKRALVCSKMREYFGDEIANKYIEQLEKHEIYCHDETLIAPYCVAISMYPFLTEGLKAFGGETKAPKHLSSYNGGFINLVFAMSSQFCGAVATVEYLLGFDHFAKIDYGEDYLEKYPDIIKQELQQVVYAINQPASARGMQSCFWNLSIFDKYFFDGLFSNFVFPDNNESPKWESIDKLQRFFMKWFNEERTKAILTFPVVTVAMLRDDSTNTMFDTEYVEFITKELSEGNSFFIYTSNTVDSLSSCCRLKNNIADQINDFSYSLGAGGVMTGSMNVITLNMNRFVQDNWKGDLTDFLKKLHDQIKLIHKYLIPFKLLFMEFNKNGILPAYKAHYIDLNKQYLTVGINGVVESAEYLGLEISPNEAYKKYLQNILNVISTTNKETVAEYPDLHLKINCEQVPAESLGVKFAKWDLADGYKVPRKCYNSYMYIVEDNNTTVLDKMELHGNDIMKYMDGGAACHINLKELPTQKTFKELFKAIATLKCEYLCFNVKVTVCNDCGYIDKRTLNACSQCGSTNVDYATRIIGYLKRISNFSKDRRIEEFNRCYSSAKIS